MIAAETGFAHDLLESDVGRTRHRGEQRAAGDGLRIARGFQQHLQIGALHHVGLVALVDHGEARGNIGLERKLLEQPGAQRVDGLHLQSARRLQRAGEQLSCFAAQFSVRMGNADVADRCIKLRIVQRHPMAKRGENALAMLAAAALVKVMQRIFSGGTPDNSSRITRCTSTCVLPEPALADTKADAVGSRRAASDVSRTAFGDGA